MRIIIANQKDYIYRSQLDFVLSQRLREGWEIVYVLPYIAPPPVFSLGITGDSGSWHFNPQTGFSDYVAAQQQMITEPTYEVYMVKCYSAPILTPEPEPCPRCSHLNPDRMDREI